MTIEKSKRVCFVCTHSLTLATLYKGLFPYLRSEGWDVTVIVGDTEYTDFPYKDFGEVHPIIIPMKRLPSPKHDLIGLRDFVRHFSENEYDVVHVSTPKAALLASLGRRLSGRSGVVFVYRRCVYEMMTGLKRELYLFTDRITGICSDVVVPISRQLQNFLGENYVIRKNKLVLLGNGSSNGVNVDAFAPSDATAASADRLRAELKIDPARPVLLFIGRICSEKGVDSLPEVMIRVRETHPGAQLIVAGPDDARDPITDEATQWFTSDPDTRRLGFVSDTAGLFALCTLFVFPSHFEGFGNVLLEAASAGKASVAFDVPGVQEAVANGVSGILVPRGARGEMAEAISGLLSDQTRLATLERSAVERVRQFYQREIIWGQIDALFRRVSNG